MFRRSCPMPGTRPTRRPTRLLTAIAAPFTRYLSRQAAHPTGAVGRFLGRTWVHETAAVNDVALELLSARPGERIAEIGSGPGRTLGLLADLGADVVGVDASPDMVRLATRRNAAQVAAGRITVTLGDGTAIPVDTGTLDGAISVHSIYFWPEPATVLGEIRRALRPGGRLVLAFRAGDHPLPRRLHPDIYTVPTIAQASDWLRASGFGAVHVEQRQSQPTVVWISAQVGEGRPDRPAWRS